MRITWYGHACFLYQIGGKRILVDPFLKDNPSAPIGPQEIRSANIVLVTHDHFDHLGDAVDILKRTGASSVAVYELASWFEKQGVKTVIGANVGGTVRLGEISVSLVPAIHSCENGVPVGYVITDGKENVYHAGDTSYFAEMEFIGRHYKPKVACMPIGGLFTMDVGQAIEAASAIKPRYFIPMHYNTWDPIRVQGKDLQRLVRAVKKPCKVRVMKPGETAEL
ncbi:MAG: metal-dependent hydrolase [Thaumarchaeota archaeon]|nr:metal-dependent hydrolase [Nitrososphaerota archaeon]